jgi:hypothetical protein
MKQPCWATGQAFRYNLPFRLQNAMEFLTTPGTFAFNNKTSTLYYLPRPGEDLKTADVEVGNLTSIVALNGTTSSPVANITFNGIGFEYSTWTQPDQDVGFVPEQATIFVTSASEVQKWDATGGTAGRTTPAAFAEHTARSVGVYNSTFTHLGAAGLAMDGGTQSSTVRGNSFTDISGNDIQVGTVTHPQQSDNALIDFNDVIKDNYISHAGVEFWGGIGIWAGYVQRIQIQHNEIDNSGYSAISIGWGWGYAPTVPNISADNVISDNYINTNKLWRSDGGGIYTLGPQKSNHPGKISGNYIINNWGAGAPLYFDQGSTYWNVSGNVEQNEVHGNYLGLNPNSNDPTGTINFTNNYTDGQPGKCGCKSAVISGTTFYNGALPGAAQAIADGAGLEPAYRYLATNDGAIETPLAHAFAYPYPYPWTYRFSFANHNGKYSINGAGADIWQGNDEYGSIYQPGSFGPGSTAVVRVDGESDTDGWAKAGLVVRNRLAAGGTSVARSVYPNDQFGYAALVLTPSNRVSLQWDGNSSGQLNQSVSVGASTLHTPIWLRLVDGDGTLTGSYSTDGTKWTTVGTAKLTGAASVEDAGMIWSAHTNGVVGTATFSNFLVGDPITGVASSRCVDIPNSDPANGNQLQIFDCNKTKAQAWTFPGDGTIRAEGKCMDVQSAKIADGTPVETYDCNGTKAQQWTYNSTTKQFQALGKCLAATGGGTTNYTKLVIDTCQAGASNQQWSHP